MRLRSTWRKVLLAVITFLIALEVLLQVAAAVASVVTASRDDGSSDKPHVLCVGDSFTYGVGATSQESAYPAALERKLRELGYDIPVINGGWPGRTSRDLINYFGGRLTAATKVLCILVGTNDTWRQPDLVTDAELIEITAAAPPVGGGFTWQWRTAKLVSLIFGFKSSTWLETGAATPEARYASADQVLARRSEAYELLSASGFTQRDPVQVVYDQSSAVTMRQYWQLTKSKNFDEAMDLVQAASERQPDSPRFLFAQVKLQALLSLPLADTLQQLEQLHADAPSPATMVCLMHALQVAGHGRRAITLAKARIAEEPDAMDAWVCRQLVEFELGMWDDFAESAPRAIELAAWGDPMRVRWALRNYANFIAADQPERAARLAIIAFLLDPTDAPMRLCMKKAKEHVQRPVFDKVLATVDLDDAIAKQLNALSDEIYDGKTNDAWQGVLVKHVQTLGDLAARHGTKVVILNYPFWQESVMACQQDVAESLGAEVALVHDRFAEVLKTKNRTELFVQDGHCNDGGYALIADVVAPLVIECLRD